MISELEPQPQAQVDVDSGFSRWISDLSRLLHHLLTIGAALLFVLPLVWLVGASLRQSGQVPPTSLEWLPQPLVLANYPHIFDLVPLGLYLLNSLKVVALAVPLTLVTASWAGFAMAQVAARPRRVLLLVSVATLLVPVTALLITRFMVYKWLGVLDTLWALILPSLMGSSPFYVLIFYWSFSRLPSELCESARVEGAGALRIWALIAAPLARPAFLAVAVLSFVSYWSNFLDPLLYLHDQRNYTLPAGLQMLQQLDITNFPLLMAGAVVLTLPVVLLYLLAQRYFLEGTRDGSLIER